MDIFHGPFLVASVDNGLILRHPDGVFFRAKQSCTKSLDVILPYDPPADISLVDVVDDDPLAPLGPEPADLKVDPTDPDFQPDENNDDPVAAPALPEDVVAVISEAAAPNPPSDVPPAAAVAPDPVPPAAVRPRRPRAHVNYNLPRIII
eukprot:TRINITY_DN7453_c0_g2_i6.p2 TRINITY_DN7453_c0_g2~~TRINITY_DN7453_c0_g2_i6.p2  ORF type:complete len:149 (-),score=34.38 TRINITY_DN7453_c0_g2_i6:62-508(-)